MEGVKSFHGHNKSLFPNPKIRFSAIIFATISHYYIITKNQKLFYGEIEKFTHTNKDLRMYVIRVCLNHQVPILTRMIIETRVQEV